MVRRSRAAALFVAGILALLTGTSATGQAVPDTGVHREDFVTFGVGTSLSIPQAARPGIYRRARRIVTAEHLLGALGAVLLRPAWLQQARGG